MKTRKITIKRLEIGERVGIPNDRERATVLKRIRPGVYLVSWKGSEFEMPIFRLNPDDPAKRWPKWAIPGKL